MFIARLTVSLSIPLLVALLSLALDGREKTHDNWNNTACISTASWMSSHKRSNGKLSIGGNV